MCPPPGTHERKKTALKKKKKIGGMTSQMHLNPSQNAII
jgi:hypothetical protein